MKWLIIPSWRQMHRGLLVCSLVLACIGLAMLYSAAGGTFSTMVERQVIHFALGISVMLCCFLIPLTYWLRYAYVIYFLVLLMLVAVDIIGHIGMGAQRWLNLGFFNIQPAELMKIALILALARYFHYGNLTYIGRFLHLLPPFIMIALPILLVLRQPSLGGATIIGMIGVSMLFLAGMRWWIFALAGIGAVVAAPIGWQFLHEYQKLRVLTFLNPERDPLGAGYNVMQSMIAIGSGGLYGKGYIQGSQSQLSFLPEKQTDFIYTMLAEELGFLGGFFTLTLFALLLWFGVRIALNSQHHFGRLAAFSLSLFLFFHIFINIGMAMGLLPVVGVPLPFLSYGGTIMLTAFATTGLLLNIHIYREEGLRSHRFGR